MINREWNMKAFEYRRSNVGSNSTARKKKIIEAENIEGPRGSRNDYPIRDARGPSVISSTAFAVNSEAQSTAQYSPYFPGRDR
jgi:hypothetical protein